MYKDHLTTTTIMTHYDFDRNINYYLVIFEEFLLLGYSYRSPSPSNTLA